MKIAAHQAKRCLDAIEQNMCHEFYKISDIELRTRFLNRLREIAASGRPDEIDGNGLRGIFLALFGEPEPVTEEPPAPKNEPPPAGKPIADIMKNGEPMHFNIGEP